MNPPRNLQAVALALSLCFGAGQLHGATTNAISAGETFTNAAISVIGEIDYYTFSGVSNEAVTIMMSKTGGTGSFPYFQLLAPDGTIVALPTFSAFIALEDAYKLTQTGTYTILCRDDGGTETFTYNLTLIKNPGPNAADEEASVILAGQTLTNRSIGLPADLDIYTFSGVSNEAVTIMMSKTGGTGSFPYFQLHAPDGTIVALPTYGSVVALEDAYKLTQTGTYQILCRDDGGTETFTYNLTLIKNPGPNAADEEASVILAGQTLTNRSIGLPADLDIYTFSGVSNEAVTIMMSKTGGTGSFPYFQLLAPDGTIVALPTYGALIALEDAYKLTQTGTYQILCRDDGGTETFTYNLTLIKNPGPNAADEEASVILAGQTLTNRSIGLPADLDIYTFSGVSNEAVTIMMSKTGGTGSFPYFQLLAPDGTIVALPFYNSVVALEDAYKLTQTGTYQILCRDDGGTETFTYNLTLIKNPGPNAADEEASVILAGQTLTNRSIGLPADLDIYTFSGVSNEAVTIMMSKTGGTGSFPYFQLHAPDGTIVALPFYNSVVALEDAYKLTQTGTYQILCRDDGGDQTFTYNLTLIKNPGPNLPDLGDSGPSIQPGQVMTNTIGSPSDIDALSFYAIAGDTVTVSVAKIAGSGNYPYLQVQAPDGTVLANATGLSSAKIHLDCLEQTGNYMVICRDDGGNETFTYRLSLIQSPIELPSSGTNQYLTIYTCSDEQVYLRWNINATGFALQGTTNLSLPVWLAVTNIPYTIADHLYVNVGFPTNQSAFYRLICTNGTCGQ